MMAGISWTTVVAMLTAATIIGGMVIGWVRWQLRGDFASSKDVGDLALRIDKIDARLRDAPSHDDVRQIASRLAGMEVRMGGLEGGHASVIAELRGVRDGVGRVEAAVSMLMNHELAEARAAKLRAEGTG